MKRKDLIKPSSWSNSRKFFANWQLRRVSNPHKYRHISVTSWCNESRKLPSAFYSFAPQSCYLFPQQIYNDWMVLFMFSLYIYATISNEWKEHGWKLKAFRFAFCLVATLFIRMKLPIQQILFGTLRLNAPFLGGCVSNDWYRFSNCSAPNISEHNFQRVHFHSSILKNGFYWIKNNKICHYGGKMKYGNEKHIWNRRKSERNSRC